MIHRHPDATRTNYHYPQFPGFKYAVRLVLLIPIGLFSASSLRRHAA